MKSMKMMKKAQQGFTLIELMIVVAIIGILAAVAIPQYQNYTIKAKIANALTAVDSIKTAVALCIQEAGGVKDGCDGGSNGVPDEGDFLATKEVDSIVSITDGAITEKLATGIGSGVDGLNIVFTPNVSETATNLTWQITTTVTNTVAKDAITKNSIAAATTPGPAPE